jgi:phage FluMu protein gp41
MTDDTGTGVTPFPLGSRELSAKDILAANDDVKERVEVPEWHGFVWVRGLTGAERDAFENSIIEGRGRNRQLNLLNFRAKLVAASAVDNQGNRLFTDPYQVEQLGKKSARALQRVFDKAQELSGLNEEDVDQLTAELGKDQNGVSGSDSPSLLASASKKLSDESTPESSPSGLPTTE